MPGKDVIAFAKKNQTLTIVGVGAALVTAWIAFRSFTGGGSSGATTTTTPAPTPTPAPVDTSGGSTAGGGGASSGIDLASLVAALSGSQQSGADSGVALGQAGLQAGVGLGTAGLQAGVDLGTAGLQVGQNLGIASLGLAQGVTDTLGNALQVSISAQAGQTTAVTGGLMSFLSKLVGPKSATIPSKGSSSGASRVTTTTATRGAVTSTSIGAKTSSSIAKKPGITTPVGHIALPKVTYKAPVKAPVARYNVKPIRL